MDIFKKIEKSFAVGLWETFFNFVRKYHPHGILFRIVQKKLKISEDERLYAFIDLWVHFHLMIAVILWAFWGIIEPIIFLMWFFILYGVLRISYIIIYNINVILFDQFRINTTPKFYNVRSYRRILICLFINYAEILLWFAIFYRFFRNWFSSYELCLDTLWGSVYFSIVTMTTLGYGDIKPINNCGAFLCSIQTLIGVFWAIVMIARFITVLPKIESLDPDEKKSDK